jgi:DNA-binding transcriptional regulator GbsR (MarR family)
MTKKMIQAPPPQTTSNGDPTSDLVLTEEQQDLIERFGILHDQLGHSPATGRIIGLLLVAPSPALTFDEIRDALGLSKSSTSAGLNLLLNIGSVTYTTRPWPATPVLQKELR